MISVKLNLFSNALSMNQDCRVLLPEAVNMEEQVPVLWLYHGGSGDENEWMYHSTIAELPDQYHIAMVLVNANDSCFTDMAYGLPYATYIGKELPETLWSMFPRLSTQREQNWISGLSNGGYGALLIGLTFPERFGAIGAFSAGDKADVTYVRAGEGEITPRIRMFGAEEIQDTPYSIRCLARKVSRESTVRPRIYHACGGEDPWLELNLLVKETFEALNDPEFDYLYDQMEGFGHEWSFWDCEIRKFLGYLNLPAANRQ